MYDNVDKAISDMQNSRHGHSKTKAGKFGKMPSKDNSFMMQNVSPIEMSNSMCGMPMDMKMNSPMMMDMNMLKMNLMDMNTPMMDMNMPMMDMKNPMGMDMCGCQFPMAGQMVSPQMIQNPVPQCMQELYMAYPYLNPNR